MGLFDTLLGTTASANSATSTISAEQSITRSGEYYLTNSSVDMARQQQLAMMNTVHTQKPPLVFDPDNPAWSESISTIVDLWLAKFGDKWVDEKDLLHDTFFAIVATRLLQTNRLEKHTVPTNFFSVYRIVE
jgi:hypothetical protein